MAETEKTSARRRPIASRAMQNPNPSRRMRFKLSRHRCWPNLRISSNVSRANSTCRNRRTSSRRGKHLFLCQFLNPETQAQPGIVYDAARLCVLRVIADRRRSDRQP